VKQVSQEELDRINEAARVISLNLAPNLQPWLDAINTGLMQKFQSSLDTINANIAQNFQPMLDAINASIATLLQRFEEALKPQQWFLQLVEGLEKADNITEAFQECDLWLSPSMVELTGKVLQLYSEGKKQVIPSVVCRYYQKNNYAILRKTVSYWENNRFFRPRMKIFYDALEAHINGKYTLSVPTLLPHIEGIAEEIIEKYNLSKLKEPLVYQEEAYGEKTSPSTVFSKVAIRHLSVEEWIAIQGLLYYLEGTMYLSTKKISKRYKDFATKNIVHRHSILHGKRTKYATSMNSLRCFLALDVLSLIDGKETKLVQ